MRKVLFVLSNMTGIGGIETSFLNLLKEISILPDMKISICVLGNKIERKDRISRSIQIIPGNKEYEYMALAWKRDIKCYGVRERFRILAVKFRRRVNGVDAILRHITRKWKIEGDYDVAISYANDVFSGSFFGGCEEVVLDEVSAKKKIAWIHNDIRKLGITRANSSSRYARFDVIVNVSDACKRVFDDEFPELEPKSIFMHNLCDEENIIRLARDTHELSNIVGREKRVFVTVARLENKQKRIDKIIDTVCLLKRDGVDDLCWYIVGDGPDKQELIELSEKKKVDDVIRFVGYKKNPYAYMNIADAIVMTSDYESYGMVLAEGLTLGRIIVVTDHEGIEEVIQDGINGLVCKNTVQDLYLTLSHVLANKEEIANSLNFTVNSNAASMAVFKGMIATS